MFRCVTAVVVLVGGLTACGGSGNGTLATESASEAATSPSTVPSTDAIAAAETTTATTVAAITTTRAPTTTAAPTTVGEIEMPDLVGLTETEAKSRLRAAGVADVTVEEQESLELSGSVLRQVPSASGIVRGPVTIVVAIPLPAIEDWAGKNLAEARRWFEDRGVTVTVEQRLTDEAQAGTVISTTPGAGQTVGTEVLIIVAERPFAQAVTEFEWLEACGNARAEDAEVDGALYPRSVALYVRRDILACSIDVNLSRDWTTFTASLGLRDDSPTDGVVRFEILADGNTIFRESLGFGTTKVVNLDVSSVLRLRLIASWEAGTGAYYAIWGEAKILGPPENATGG